MADVIPFPVSKRHRYRVRYWIRQCGLTVHYEEVVAAYSTRDALQKATRSHWDQLFGRDRTGHVTSVLRFLL